MNATPKQLPRYCHCTHGSAGNLPVHVTYVTFTAVLSHKVLLRWYIITAVFTHLFGHEYVFHSYYVITLLRRYSVMSMFLILITLLRRYSVVSMFFILITLLRRYLVMSMFFILITLLRRYSVMSMFFILITLLRYYGVTWS